MNSQKKSEISIIILLIIAALISLCGCAHTKEIEYYEGGQIKKDSEKYGVLFSDGKEISLIKIN